MGWDALREHHARVADRRILDLIDEARPEAFSVRAEGLVFDYAKTNLDAEGRRLLLALAEEAGVAERRGRMFAGAPINETEGRAVLHTALRNLDGGPVRVGGEDVMPGVLSTLARMERFAAAIRDGHIRCPGGGVFTDVVNIGIGGSDLGPAMAVQALAPYADGPRCHFVSNVDPAHIHDVLAGLNPAATLVIVASKTFTTAETMANAHTAREWIAAKVGTDTAGEHFVALSSNLERTAAFGIAEDRVFGFADWVGGRYSVWGPIGLSLMLAIGAENFRAFLEGGQAMDRHFREAEGPDNMPLMLGLVGLWHAQVCGHATRAVLPYEQRLARLPAYLQQLEMESNGKRVAMDGSALEAPSGPVVWGEPGTNGQHAFMQLIHQGTRVVPVEFMVGRAGHEPDLAAQHRMLQANCLAQGEALLRGRSLEEARAKLAGSYEGEELERQARHRVMPGNRPSTTLVYPKLTPFVLGQILALYEHRVFVEGAVLGINSFDQWGVELGKELATALVPVLEGEAPRPETDSATRALADVLRG